MARFRLHLPLHLPQKLPFQLVLIAPFLIQISVSVGLTGYLSFRNGQKTVNDLANQLTQRTNDVVSQHLASYLAGPPQITQAVTDEIYLGLLNSQDLPAIQRFLLRQVQNTNVTYVNYGLVNGDYVGAGHFGGQGENTFSETSARTQHKNSNYLIDAEGRPSKLLEIDPEYDHKQEGWYRRALQAKKAVWSEPYVWTDGTGTVSIAAGRPVFDAHYHFIGAVGVDLELADISQFLRSLNISSSAGIFIIERNGSVIASSNQEPPVKQVNQKIERLNVLNSQDPMMRATAQSLQRTFGGFETIQANQQLEFQFEGERQFVHVTPWKDRSGLDWLVVVRLPESNFTARINQNARTTLLLCIAALAVAILSGLLTSRKITQIIQKLNQASRSIAEGNLDQTVETSCIQELSLLSDSFNQMAHQLRDSFTALETINAELEDRVEERTIELQSALSDLQQTQFQLIQTEKMSSLGQLVAGVAHEINNPVNFIHGNLTHASQYMQDLLHLVHLFQQHYPDPDIEIQDELEAVDLEFLQGDSKKLFQSMQIGTERIREIVLSLRNFSRLDEAEFKTADIHEGIDSTLMILENRLKARPDRPAIQVMKDYGPIPPVECYPGQLNQVLMNLITNAIDALDEFNERRLPEEKAAHPSILRIQTELIEPQRLEIRISDNGPGMSAAVQSRLFDPFFTTKPVGKGTGLGLSISYKIITEKHQGQLKCISAPGAGATFVIDLPVRQVMVAEPKNPVSV